MSSSRRARGADILNVMVFCFALSSLLTACSFEPAPGPSEGSSAGTAESTRTESPATPDASSPPGPTASSATFSGVENDVAFSFAYPATWTVTKSDPSIQNGGDSFVITNEAGTGVASFTVLPYLEVGPCSAVCADASVSYLGEVPGQGTLAGRSYSIQTKAMDLTSRGDLQEANGWENNVRLLIGVAGVPGTTPAEDPVHFTIGAGIQTGSTSDSLRPIVFSAHRDFGTMAEAKAYTSSGEHAQIQAMMRSLQATAAVGTSLGSQTPVPTRTG